MTLSKTSHFQNFVNQVVTTVTQRLPYTTVRMTKSSSDKTENAPASLLPLAPRTLCFDKNEFMKKDFSVDNFVADCRRKVRLETLRQDLEIYFKLLKNAMIELINKDYADFVNLSTNLVGLDKAIGQLRSPLRNIREDVSEVESTIKAQVVEVEAAFAHQRKLSEKRKLLGHMLGLLKAAEKIEHIQNSEDAKSGQALERIAGEFNQLQHHASFCKGLPVLNQIRQRVAEITSKLQSSLEHELVVGLDDNNTKQVHRCLNSYALISKSHDAETLVRVHVVDPFMKQIIEEQHGNTEITSLSRMFQRILELVPNHLKLLCDVTSGRKNKDDEQYRGIPGYDFVVNSAWPQIVATLEKDLPELFSSRDPNFFHKRFQLCMDFVSNFERQCGSQASISRLRSSEAYNALMTHWSLPVYFQIRFQEIGGKLENALSSPVKDLDNKESKFRLQSTAALLKCIESCWNSDIYLPALLHRFWKLTLQLLSRYNFWIKQVYDFQVQTISADFTDLSLQQLAHLIVDLGVLCEEAKSIYQKDIEPRAMKQGLKDASVLQGGLDEFLDSFAHCKTQFIKHIITTLTAAALPHLKQTQDVPRLYRKTNRPAPTEASTYLSMVTGPAISFRLEQRSFVDEAMLTEWLTEFTSIVSEKYHSTVSDVLTSVRKMEESMMRLQKMRSGKYSSGNLASLAASNDTLSDDDKIRHQLFLDVVNFGKQMGDCGVNMEGIENYQLLLKMVHDAKNQSNLS